MKSLYSKIIIPITSLIIVALTSIIIFSVANINLFISPDIKNITKDLMTSKSNEISYWLNMRISEMEQLAAGIEGEEISDNHIDKYIHWFRNYQIKNNDNYESFGIITPDGLKHLTTGEVITVDSRDYFKEISNTAGEYIVTDPIISKSNRKQIILIIIKIKDKLGQVKGYLSGAVSIEYLNEVVNSANIYNFPVKLYNKDTGKELVSTIDGAIDYDKNTKFTEFYGDINEGSNWAIKMMVPDSFINRKIQGIGMVILLFGVIIICATVYILNKYVKSIVRPIENLKGHMKYVEEGKFNSIIPDNNSLELNSLGNSFNAMIHNIKILIHKLEHEEHLKKEAEYKALYSQIKPHFLYNTLETIQAMAITVDNDDVETAIGDLATLFRIGLSSDKSFISIEDELNHLESYVNIQLLRYRNRFTYSIDKKDLIPSSKFMKFTLQPLVENAIYHGIKLMDDRGYIKVVIHRERDKYIIKIINSCDEVDQEKLRKINNLLENGYEKENNTEGYGLYNVNQRLKLNFGIEYGVKLQGEHKQVIAVVTHPILKEDFYA